MGVDRLMEFIVLEAPSITDMPAPVNSKGAEVKARSMPDPLRFMFLNPQLRNI